MLPAGSGLGPPAFLGERKRDGRWEQQVSFSKSERNEKADVKNTDLACFVWSGARHKAIGIETQVKVKLNITLTFLCLNLLLEVLPYHQIAEQMYLFPDDQ